MSDIYPTFIEPTITWVPSGFSGYIWLDTKIVFKKKYECLANRIEQHVKEEDCFFHTDPLYDFVLQPVEHPHGGGNHQHIGKPSTVARTKSSGRKVRIVLVVQSSILISAAKM